MNWVTILWSAAAAACTTLALMHLAVWCRQPRSYAYLFFSICALSVAAISMCELRMMFTVDAVSYGKVQRWTHIPIFTATLGLVAFVYVHFQSGLLWLAVTTVGVRFCTLILNFASPINLNFAQITSVGRIVWPGGESVSYPIGIVNPLVILGQLSSLLLLAFVADASIRCWRAGNCQRAVWLGGSICMFIILAAGHSALINYAAIRSPYLISFPFLGTAIVMAVELSSGILQAARLGERLRTSQANLQKTEQRLGVAADAAKLGMWTWDIPKDTIWMNENCALMLGRQEGDVRTLAEFYELIRPLDLQRVRDAVQHAINAHGDYDCEFGLEAKPTGVRWIASRGRVELDAAGTPAHLHGVCVDVTQRHQSEERFRAVFDSAPNALIITDSKGTMVLANGEAERVFQFTRRELLGHPITVLLPNAPVTNDPHHLPPVEDSRTAAPATLQEAKGRRKDGTSVPLEVGFTRIQTSADSLILVFILDVTERNEALRVAAVQRSEIAHLSRITMLGEVSGSIAHELNQPLTAIMTNAETAQRFLAHTPPNTTELNIILHEIVNDVARAAEVIRLLRVLQKKSDAEYREIDMHAIIADVARILGTEAAMRNIRIQLRLPANLPTVRGDKVQLEQVMINLLLNAFDAMAHNEAQPRSVTIATLDEEDMVSITVSDNGLGIEEASLQRMFDAFYTSKPNGLGLGLSIYKTIVETHGGRLNAENNVDHGATLRFTLPRFVPAEHTSLVPA